MTKLFIEDLSEYGRARRLPTLTRQEVCAIVTAAHKDHRLAIAHVQSEAAAREAVECGVDALAHMFPDRIASHAFIALAKEHRIFIETTDSVWAGSSATGMAQRMAADPRVAPLLSGAQKTTLLSSEGKGMPDFFPNALASTRALHAAGIPLLAGTDAPNPATAHGVSLHQKLQILVDAGFTPDEALRAATSLPARIFHLEGRGLVQPGYRADLLLVSGDPAK